MLAEAYAAPKVTARLTNRRRSQVGPTAPGRHSTCWTDGFRPYRSLDAIAFGQKELEAIDRYGPLR